MVFRIYELSLKLAYLYYFYFFINLTIGIICLEQM